jgi:NADPH:quinone reductase-like Zn-dependent oxidoreductase
MHVHCVNPLPDETEMRTTSCYAVTSDAIDRERNRPGIQDGRIDLSRVIHLCDRPLSPVGPHDVELEILAVSAEHNVAHAALGDTDGIVEKQGGQMYPGNSAVGLVVDVGRDVEGFAPGDIVQTHCNAKQDRHGYPERIWAYDAPGSVGWFSERAVVGDWQIIRLPLDRGLSLWELAALPLRAPTAYHLWRRALGIYRLKVPREQRARLHVLAFGGGVSELFLMLARAEGHHAYFCSGNRAWRDVLAQRGVSVIDQTEFNRFANASDVERFGRRCKELTGGEGMHIVCDMLRGSVFDAGLKAAAREGVNVSAGWQLSRLVSYNSALLSVKQITLDHVHYETVAGCKAVTELYGHVLRPTLHHEVYAFEDLPRCFEDMHRNRHTGIPIIRVAERLPDSVKALTSVASERPATARVRDAP